MRYAKIFRMDSPAEATREHQTTAVAAARVPWAVIAWFGALLVACYAPVLVRLVRQWISDPDMGHGVFVPLVAAYVAWQNRNELLATPAVTNWWGMLLVAWGAAQLLVATLGAELSLARTAFVISVVGVVWFLGGTHILQRVAFPLVLLFFMVPIPAIIFNQITFPLQLVASRIAELAISLLGIPVFREGNILELPSQRLNVVEACSGIRSLLSLSFLSLVYAHFFDRRSWMKPVLLVATVPIAVAANAGRVALTGMLSENKPELAEGFFHGAQGWVIFMVALVLLVVVHRAICFVARGAHGRRS